MAHQELEMMDFGVGIGDGYSTSSAVVPQFSATLPQYHYGSLPATADTGLPLDELLDFSNKDLFPSVASDRARYYGTVANEPASLIADGSMTGKALSVPQFQHNSPFDLYIPQCEDAADLEWLSKFVEDSFSDAPYYAGFGAIAPSCQAKLRMDQTSASGRGARSKRSRSAAGTYPAADWFSLEVPLVQKSPSSSSSSSEIQPSKPKAGSAGKSNKGKKIVRDGGDGVGGSVGVEGWVRRCTHCASEKTPQWRTGPLGPKTLCNACGVRYKSGRLVPEYRPAASPTFVLTQHSNSHRKVMELRRQKEMLVIRHQEKATCVARAEPLLGDNGSAELQPTSAAVDSTLN